MAGSSASSGAFPATVVTDYIAQPRAFTLPAGIGNGPLTIAVRMWMDAHTPLIEAAAGGLHGPPVLGQTPIVMAMQRLDWDAVNRSASSEFPEAAILLLAIAVAFSLFLLDRTESAYLWLGANCIVILSVIFRAPSWSYYTTWIPAMPAVFLRDVVLLPLQMALWIVFWACWFRLDERERACAAGSGCLWHCRRWERHSNGRLSTAGCCPLMS